MQPTRAGGASSTPPVPPPPPLTASSSVTAAPASSPSPSPYRALPVGATAGLMSPAAGPATSLRGTGAQVYRSLSAEPRGATATAAAATDPLASAMAHMVVHGMAKDAKPSTQPQFAALVSPAPLARASSAPSAAGIPRLPLPLDLFPLSRMHAWFTLEDPEEVVARVESALGRSMEAKGGDVRLQRGGSSCRFECRAHGSTTAESCDFAVSLFDAKGEAKAPGRFVAEAERMAGCPFLFEGVMCRLLSETSAMLPVSDADFPPAAAIAAAPWKASGGGPAKRAFVALDLPAELCAECPCGRGAECACTDADIEAMVRTALSSVQEQRAQAACCLADSCARDAQFARRLARVARGSADELRALAQDADPVVRRAGQRLGQMLHGCARGFVLGGGGERRERVRDGRSLRPREARLV